ncbi:calcium-binding protein [Pseudomonas aeruginosa]|nr:calcium-binding protein [Pseudomonas aeruginosa]
MKALVQQATDGNDRLYGYAVADTLSGLGNDSLYGYAGNDLLQGDEGHEHTLRWRWRRYPRRRSGQRLPVWRSRQRCIPLRPRLGPGHHSKQRQQQQQVVDAIEFGSGISANDILLNRDSDNLVLTLKNSTDRITVSSYFNQDATSNYRLEEIRFVDGAGSEHRHR